MASVEFRPFLVSDLMALDVQEIHADAKRMALESIYTMLAIGNNPNAFTCLEDGVVKACIGEFNGEIWAFLGKDLKRIMVPLTRYGLKKLAAFGRAKAWIDNDNPNAVRWAELGGFRPSTHGYWYFE